MNETHGGLLGVLAGVAALLATLVPRVDAWVKERRALRDEQKAKESGVDDSIRESFTLLLASSRSEIEAYKREVTQLREENTQLREENHKLHERMDVLESRVRELTERA